MSYAGSEDKSLKPPETKRADEELVALIKNQKTQHPQQEEKQEILVQIHKETRKHWIEEHIQWMNQNYEVLDVELKSYMVNDEITYVACVVF